MSVEIQERVDDHLECTMVIGVQRVDLKNNWKVNINTARTYNHVDGGGGREMSCQEGFSAWGPGWVIVPATEVTKS